MKATTKFGLKGFKGNVDGMVYYTIPNSDVIIGRTKPDQIKQAQQHKDYGNIARNLKKIKPVQAYRDDFKMYLGLYRALPEAKKSVSMWYNLYITLLWDMQKAGIVDLKTITREKIYNENLPCISVKAAVEAGFLPEVVNYQMLDKTI